MAQQGATEYAAAASPTDFGAHTPAIDTSTLATSFSYAAAATYNASYQSNLM